MRLIGKRIIYIKHSTDVVVEYFVSGADYDYITLTRSEESFDFNLPESRLPKTVRVHSKDIKIDRLKRQYVLWIDVLDVELKLTGQPGVLTQLVKSIFKGK